MHGARLGYGNCWMETMSKQDRGDQDLRDAFSVMRAEDNSAVPLFSVPESKSDHELRRWKLRPAIPIMAAGVVILLSISLIPRSQKQAVSEIKFDELSELISREFLTVSAGNWTAPSDFLFEYSKPLTQ